MGGRQTGPQPSEAVSSRRHASHLLRVVPMKPATMLVAAWLALGSGLVADDDVRPIRLPDPALNQARVQALPGGRLSVAFEQAAQWPGVHWKAPAGQSWDWSGAGALVLSIANPGTEAVEFNVRIDDDARADGTHFCKTARGTIAAGATERFALPFSVDPMSVGMRGLPGPKGFQTLGLGGEHKLELGHITGFLLFLTRPEQAHQLTVNGAGLARGVELDGMVDRFGQYARDDWPGKLHDESEFSKRRADEESALASAPALPGRDAFGGWADGPKLEATGFFRTQKVGNTWWLVDPAGHLFFSAGIDCVDPNEATIIAGRERFFSWLPAKGDPLAAAFGEVRQVHRGPVTEGRTFDFYRANLQRKYGADWEASWRDTALKRLPAWGFNTIANWSTWDLYRNGRVPYVATAGVYGDHARVASGSDYWGKMHDPFDPKFRQDLDRSLRSVVDRVKGDPWCIGYFVDNELSWGRFDAKDPSGRIGLAIGALQAGADSPAHRAILEDLQSKYTTIEKLNAAWGTEVKSWAELGADGWAPKSPYNEAVTADLTAFVTRLAREYFRTVNASLKALDPDHMYLGCRFAWKTAEAIQAASEVCDVVSFNIYARRVDPKEWAFLNDLGKPAIIGEFHVGALDRGMFHTGLVSAGSQAERAAVFGDYVGTVIDHPALVGCHWFQYEDQPLTGRSYDGENYNIGFVTVTDTPYPEMVETARKVLAPLYERRSKADKGSPSVSGH